jgi:UDP-2,4-diacetamido-2,4,6-trideoxy-beta-L-altropyranose hydrolase
MPNDDNSMNIVFRVDASIHIGSGHIMRCLTLAEELKEKGCHITFVCRELPGNLISIIKNKGHFVCQLDWQDDSTHFNWYTDVLETINAIDNSRLNVDLLIVDHYQIDSRWEANIRDYSKKIMVIDDLADRKHDCDILLDQNYYKNFLDRYDAIVPTETIKLLGPQFALLRKQFHQVPESLKGRSGEINNILIFMGGSDLYNLTSLAIRALQLIRKKINIDVIIGSSNPHYSEVQELCDSLQNTKLHVQIDNMADLMVQADLAIGAGGSTTWERCYLGLPSITLVFADNQLETTSDLAEIGVINFLGWADNCNVKNITDSVQDAIDNPLKMREMGRRALDLMGNTTPVSVSATVLDILSVP